MAPISLALNGHPPKPQNSLPSNRQASALTSLLSRFPSISLHFFFLLLLVVVVVVKKEPEGVVAGDEGLRALLLLGAPARLRKLLGGFLGLLLHLVENLMWPSLTQTLPPVAPR